MRLVHYAHMISRKVPLPAAFRAMLVTSGLAVTFVGGFLIGRVPFVHGQTDDGQVIGLGQMPSGLSGDENFSMFWDVWNTVKKDFVDQPVTDKTLFYGALEGLVAS